MASSKRKGESGVVIDADILTEKRTRIDEDERGDEAIVNEYRGFSLQGATAEHPPMAVENEGISARDFFVTYVSNRYPCVIQALPKLPSGKSLSISLDVLREVAGNEVVQVERRLNATESFGQNRTLSRQMCMTIADFVKNLSEKDGDLFYLSTQEATGAHDIFQAPCKQLLEHQYIGSSLPWAGNLILSSCNIWIGKSRDGSSSGLHHDYHDNFYLLLEGRKRFRIYSPDCAPIMYTFGRIDKIHFNGRISYKGSETRADGVPLEAGEEELHVDDNEEEDSDDDEEEVVLGKGYDFSDDSDDDADGFRDDEADDFDEIMLKGDQVGTDEGLCDNSEGAGGRPDSFSKIDLSAGNDRLREDYPLFGACREIVIDLIAGQTLYLPAGWFHEVTSFASDSHGQSGTGNHVALNYWYHPPDCDTFENPYQDTFWSNASMKNPTKDKVSF